MGTHGQLNGFFDPEIFVVKEGIPKEKLRPYEEKKLLGNYWLQFSPQEEVRIQLTKGVGTYVVIKLVDFNGEGKPGMEKDYDPGGPENILTLRFSNLRKAGRWGTLSPNPLTSVDLDQKKILVWISYIFEPHDAGVSLGLAFYGKAYSAPGGNRAE